MQNPYANKRLLVLPGTCPLCGTVCTGERFCPDCHNDILHSMQNHPYRCARCCLALPNAGPCPDCSEQALHTGTVIAAFDYVHPLDSLVLRYKNGRQLDLAPAFAQLLSQQLQQRGLLPLTNTCLIPIPGSRQSLGPIWSAKPSLSAMVALARRFMTISCCALPGAGPRLRYCAST